VADIGSDRSNESAAIETWASVSTECIVSEVCNVRTSVKGVCGVPIPVMGLGRIGPVGTVVLDATEEDDGDPTASGVGGVLGRNWRRRKNLSRFLSFVIVEV